MGQFTYHHRLSQLNMFRRCHANLKVRSATFRRLVVRLRSLMLRTLHLNINASHHLTWKKMLNVRLFLRVFSIVRSVIRLLLIAHFHARRVLLSLLLNLDHNSLLFRSDSLLASVQLTGVCQTGTNERLRLPRGGLNTVRMARSNTNVRAVTLLSVRFRSLSINFQECRSLNYLGNAKDIGVVIYVATDHP